MRPDYDVIIIGAGHNGLTAAGYLARAGYSVHLLERRHIIASYVVSLLNPAIIRELELEKFGLEILDRAETTLIPTLAADGGHFFSADGGEYMAKVAALSPRDAEVYPAFEAMLEMAAGVLRDLVRQTPPNLGGGLGDLIRAGKFANQLRKLGPENQAEFMKIMTMSVADYLDEWFESDVLKSLFSQQAFVGYMASPYAPGSAYVLIHHFFGEVNGKTGAWGHARGGMGAITRAMAQSAEAHGATMETGAAVEEVLIENGRAAGVRLADGRTLRARIVASNAHPRLLFERLVPKSALPENFRRRIERYRSHSGTLRMNLALDGLPRFTCLSEMSDAEQRDRLHGMILFNGDWAYCEKAFQDALSRGWSEEPIMEIYLPTTIDDGLAPPGKHVMSLFCQHFPYDLPDGRSWDEEKQVAADHVIDFVGRYCPNLRDILLGMQVLSPLDLERDFGLVRGCIMHGNLAMDQMYSMRPVPGFADYRMPVKGLYLCGAGAHPGGGVSGNPGRNAAREMIKDL